MLLWVLVAGVFISMQPLAFVGLIGLLTLLATREFGMMLRGGSVPHFPGFSFLLTIVYCGTLYVGLLREPLFLQDLELLTVVVLVLGMNEVVTAAKSRSRIGPVCQPRTSA